MGVSTARSPSPLYRYPSSMDWMVTVSTPRAGRPWTTYISRVAAARASRISQLAGSPSSGRACWGRSCPVRSSAWVERAVSQGTTSSATETLWFSR